MTANATLERIARDSYGRLVAWLARRGGDLAAAEDALSDAMCSALEQWPLEGIPERPESWLLTVARRRLIDGHRHAAVQAAEATELAAALLIQQQAGPVEDQRLGLLCACAHPALAEEVHAPLMLQAVLGLDAARIAAAFLVPPATMGQRLVRAKTKIRSAGVPFITPDITTQTERLPAVRAAIYVAFGDGRGALAEEAVDLARTLAHLTPTDPESLGLAALLLHVSARHPAQRDGAGNYVPLDLQEPHRWDGPRMAAAEEFLSRAGAMGCPGRYQWEAAIQSVHAGRRHGFPVDWPVIIALYEALLAVAPSVGAALGRVSALHQVYGPEVALAALAAMPDLPSDHQPGWAVTAHLLAATGRYDEARAAGIRAAGLSEDPAQRAWLLAFVSRLPEGSIVR